MSVKREGMRGRQGGKEGEEGRTWWTGGGVDALGNLDSVQSFALLCEVIPGI